MGATSVVVDPAKLTASGERTLRRLASLAATQMPPEQFLTALGTAVEVHVSRLLGFLVELSDIDTTPFGRALLATVEGSMTYTWEDRHKWLDRGFAVAVAGHLAGQRFDTVVEAREFSRPRRRVSQRQASRTRPREDHGATQALQG